jgi:hypothetical protein
METDTTLDQLLNTAIQDALRNNIVNIYRDTVRNIRSNRYFNTPPVGGYNVTEEYEYILPDRDDISSTILLDIVTRFGSPGNDSIHEHMKQHRRDQIKNIGKYKKIKELGEICPECSICLEEFKQGEYYRKLECTHTFHKKCIDRWFKRDHSDCPLCRKKIIN